MCLKCFYMYDGVDADQTAYSAASDSGFTVTVPRSQSLELLCYSLKEWEKIPVYL